MPRNPGHFHLCPRELSMDTGSSVPLSSIGDLYVSVTL